jgi:PAS domain S-box-containing protein
MRAAIGRQWINGVIITIVSVLAIVVLSIRQYRRIQDTGAWVSHTNQVLYQTGVVSNTALQYELNVKNFLLTGDSSFLVAAGDSAAGLPAKIQVLKALTADNPGQQGRIDSLALYIDRNRGQERAIGLRERGDVRRSQEFPGDVRGASAMVSVEIAGIEAEELRLLELRRHANEVKTSELQWELWSLIGAVALLAVLIFQQIRHDLIRQQTASEEKYKTLFNKSPLPKWIYDETTLQFLEVNETAVRTYGYSREDFRGMTILDIRPAEDRQRVIEDVGSVRRSPGAYRESQWRHLKKNGEIIDVDITAHTIAFEGRKARLVVVNDITASRLYEQQLQQLNTDLANRAAELSVSNAELERFAYIASHDLQEPLRMVSSFLQLLQKKYGGQIDAKADQYIHYAVDGAERMKALIMDLLEYSRVGKGKEGFGWVDSAEVMAEVGEVFRERIVAARAQVEIGPLPWVWGDKVQLTQLLQNLVSNALKYMGDQAPLIRIGAREEEAHWRFFVEDNGIGIDPLFFEKIFIIFQRLHNKNDYSGTGIGLAICKKIVERHGGKIWVESDQQRGSTFFFTINKKA